MFRKWYNRFAKLKRDKLNNFQRKATAEWLLNISQAAAVGGVGSLFIPGVSQQVGILGGIVSAFLALVLYLLAMYLGRKVKE